MASVAKREWTAPGGEKRSAWVVRYKDTGGAHRSRQFDKKKEADAYRTKVEGELERGTHTPRGDSAKIGAIAPHFIGSLEQRERDGRRMAASTVHVTRQAVFNHIVPAFANVVAVELTARAVDEWMGALARRGLAAKTIRNITGAFKRLVDYAMRRGYVHINVVRDVNEWPEHRHRSSPTIETFTRDEVIHLLKIVAGPVPPRLHARHWAMTRLWVYLATLGGLRHGEVRGLTWRGLDLEAGVVNVQSSLCTHTNKLKGPKSAAGYRTIPLPATVVRLLLDWRDTYAINNPLGLVFTTKSGRFVQHNNFYKDGWRPLLERAGFEPGPKGWRHFHALRHFMGSMLIHNRAGEADVARLMGHSSFDLTLRVYAHPMARQHESGPLIEGIATEILPALSAPSAQELLTVN